MKRRSLQVAVLLVFVHLFPSLVFHARADASADGELSFGSLTITPAAGVFVFVTNWQAAGFAEASVNQQFNSGSGPILASTTGDYSSATGSAFAPLTLTFNASGQSVAHAYIPGQIEASDSATAQASLVTTFMITGGVGSTNVSFSGLLDGMLNVFTDVYGQSAFAQTVFTLEVDGSPVLFTNQLFSIGPNDADGTSFSTLLSGSMDLQYGTPYQLGIYLDSEAIVSNVPEPATGILLIGGMVLLGVSVWKKRRPMGNMARVVTCLTIVTSSLWFTESAHALYIGAEAPDVCETCGVHPTRQSGGNAQISLTEGNFQEDYATALVKSSGGPTLQLNLIYNSYNADNSRARINVGLGFGWTHSYNSFLFQQRSHMFRMDGQGRVARYRFSGQNTYTPDSGYFETLTRNPDGSYSITNKNESWWHYELVSGTPYYVSGQIYRLTEMGDRNQNVTSLTYSNGLLVEITDTYGRSLFLGYTNQYKLSSVADPLGRVTRIQYDAQGRMPVTITDPAGKTVKYTYNSLYQMTRKTDRDGKMFFYTYRNQKPYLVIDGLGQTYFSLANLTSWSVNQSVLAYQLQRQYIPSTTTNFDGLGNATRYTYDTNGYITRVVTPDGVVMSYAYDSKTRRLSSVTNQNGAVTRYQYDALGNRTNMTDALGNITTYSYEPKFNMVTNMTDPNGRVTTYQYDSFGNRTNEIDALGNTTRYTYDANGNLTSQTDRRGNNTTYIYDSVGNRTNMTDALGNTTQYSYDAVGNQISMTDPLNRTTTYAYDSLNRPVGATNAAGGVTTYTYDARDRQVRITDPNNDSTSYFYDTRGRLTRSTNALGDVITHTYDANNNRIATVDESGRTTSYQYDSRNRLVTVTNALSDTTTTAYDGVGNRIAQTDPLGRTTQYTYDALNRVIVTTNALGGVTRYDYSTSGGPPCCSPTIGSSHVTRMEDANGKVTFYTYDELDRPIRTIRKVGDTNDVADLDDAVTTYTYDVDGNRTSATEPNGNMITNRYDALNRLTNSVNAAGDVTVYTYDGVGNTITTTKPNGNVTVYTYDALNRVTTSTDAIGLITTNAYDAVGNRTAMIDANGNTTAYAYDALNRLVTTTDPLGKTITYDYDAVGNRTNITDRLGRVTTYAYDSLDRRTTTIGALGNITTYAYDAVGNVTNLTDANGNATTYSYDALDRRVTEIYPDAAPNTRSYTYDAVGNLISRTNQDGRVTTYNYNDLYQRTNRAYTSDPADNMTYDLSGRMLSAERGGWVVTYSYDGANRVTNTTQNGRTISYAYDVLGRTRTVTYPGGRTIVEQADARGRLSSIDDGLSPPSISRYSYDASDRVISRTNRNGTVCTYDYNANNWITNLTHKLGITLIAGFGYDYDDEGNKRFEEKSNQPGDSEAYEYDSIYRVTNYAVGTLSGGVVPVPTVRKAWELDPVGSWNSIVSNGVPEVRTHNAANEITTINASPIYHDDNGNLEQDTAYAYSYDGENRLTEVLRLADTNTVGRYLYDALGRRVIKIASSAGIATTNVFLYDGARIIEEEDTTGLTTATYTYGNYIDEVLTMDRGGQTYYYHANALGTSHALTDSTGAVAERYTYDAYGCVAVLDAGYTPVTLNSWGTPHSAVTNAFLFTGREHDEETGLYFYRARYYDCGKGRFLQRDPIGTWGDPNNLGNGYVYVADRPTSKSDPLGLISDVDLAMREECRQQRDPGCQYAKKTGKFKVFIGLADYDIAGAVRSEVSMARDRGFVGFAIEYRVSWNPTRNDAYNFEVARPELPADGAWNWRAAKNCGMDSSKTCVEELVVTGHASAMTDGLTTLGKSRFCSPCTIWLAGCSTESSAKKVANATGCKVYGSKVCLKAGAWVIDKPNLWTQENPD